MTKDLTPGEVRALKTYCEAEYHQDAAKRLSVSTQTVKNHLAGAYRKIGAKKAHSAIYQLCLSQGFDPFAVYSSSKRSRSVVVNSESTKTPAKITEKYRESPAQYPILTQTPADDIIPNELANLIEDDSVPDTSGLPPIIEREERDHG